MATQGQLCAMELPGFWMDVGQPPDYLMGMALYLNSLKTRDPKKLRTGEGFVGPVMVVRLQTSSSPRHLFVCVTIATGLCSRAAMTRIGRDREDRRELPDRTQRHHRPWLRHRRWCVQYRE